jgi:hypothetical protein
LALGLGFWPRRASTSLVVESLPKVGFHFFPGTTLLRAGLERGDAFPQDLLMPLGHRHIFFPCHAARITWQRGTS